jgi:hypothetical protein
MSNASAAAAIVLLALLPPALGAQSPAPAGRGAESPASPGAPSPALSLPEDPALLLGMGLEEAWMAFGAPSRVYPLRGDEAWQDDVVFEYQQGFSLFWFGDRLWQIRFSPGYPGKIRGLSIGDGETALAAFGPPVMEAAGFRVFELPYRGFPLRLRARVEGGRVSEAYVYRADF